MRIQSNFNYSIRNASFQGTTKIYTVSDVHQNTDLLSRLVNKSMEESKGKDNVVFVDNGDIFKGIYPKKTILGTYAIAKRKNPNVEFVYNIGNNDPGYQLNDYKVFKRYVKTMNKAGNHVISANLVDKKTGQIPKGVKPYVVIERDNDKLIYLGFVTKDAGRTYAFRPVDAVKRLEDLAPELKELMNKDKKIKGVVLLVHDLLDKDYELHNKAQELGLNPRLLVGGHIHKYIRDDEKNLYCPYPFANAMTSLDINFDEHGEIQNYQTIEAKNCRLGIFKKKVSKVNKKEEYYVPIIKNAFPLAYAANVEDLLAPTELGTFYADGIKNISNSEIGIVPKGWIHQTLLPQRNIGIRKMDVLNSLWQPIKPIYQIKATPVELKSICQKQLSEGELPEASGNVIFTAKNGKITQINIDGKNLFDENGRAFNPDRKIITAIDYYTVRNMDIDKKALSKTMYDGFANNLKACEGLYSAENRYPCAKMIKG